MQKNHIMLIAIALMLIACIAVPVSAETITRDYNLSTDETTYTSGNVGDAGSSSPSALLAFSSTSAISGATDFGTTGVIVTDTTSKISYVMDAGTQVVRVAIAGAGDSYSLSRNTGTLTFTPISNVSSYDIFGNPTYSATKAYAKVNISLDHPMVAVTGDTTVFRIYNLENSTNAKWISVLDNENAFERASAYFYGPTLTGFVSTSVRTGTISSASSDTTTSFGSIHSLGVNSGLIYGVTTSSAYTRYTINFENIFSINSDTLSWTLDRTNDSAFTLTNPTTQSSFNITDGSKVTTGYRIGSNTLTGYYISPPVSINITELYTNTTFNEVFFSTNPYSISVVPTTPTVNTDASLRLLSETGSLSDLSTVIFTQSYQGSTKDSVPMTNYNYSSFQKNSTGYWFARTTSGYTQAIGTTLPSTFNFRENLNGDYTIYFEATDIKGQYYTDQVTFTVQGSTNPVYIPVYNVDSSTQAVIGNSQLAVNKLSSSGTWYNTTSAGGFWNVSSYGVTGNVSFHIGDYMTLVGSASGYQSQWINLYISDSTNRVTQYLALVPNSSIPIAGEFTAVINVYDASTSAAISGVTISLNNTTKITTNYGTATFSNLSSSNSYTLKATKSGYISVTQVVTGTSGEVVNVPVGMAAGVITTSPTTAVTTRITSGPTTIVPTTTGGNYSGFWGPYYQMFHAMGAEDTELGILMTACMIIVLIVIIGIITGGNLYAVNSAAALGFILSCAFGWIYFWLILAGVLWLLIPLVFRRVE